VTLAAQLGMLLEKKVAGNGTKERGHYYMCYTYVTVFVRNAANLAHILPKASRTTFT
jgi:hypothetical protein